MSTTATLFICLGALFWLLDLSTGNTNWKSPYPYRGQVWVGLGSDSSDTIKSLKYRTIFGTTQDCSGVWCSSLTCPNSIVSWESVGVYWEKKIGWYLATLLWANCELWEVSLIVDSALAIVQQKWLISMLLMWWWRSCFVLTYGAVFASNDMGQIWNVRWPFALILGGAFFSNLAWARFGKCGIRVDRMIVRFIHWLSVNKRIIHYIKWLIKFVPMLYSLLNTDN